MKISLEFGIDDFSSALALTSPGLSRSFAQIFGYLFSGNHATFAIGHVFMRKMPQKLPFDSPNRAVSLVTIKSLIMPKYSVSPVRAAMQFLHSRELIWQLIWREVAGRYRGSFAGLLWSFLNPLFSLAMYTFVFGVVFKARWGLKSENTFDFALVLFAGLIVHGLLSECIIRAPHLVLGNSAYVKQVVFPLEILPVVALGSSVFHTAISILLLVVIWIFAHGSAPLAAMFIPLLLAPLCLIAAGLSWLLSATTVYFRDIDQIVTFISTGLLFFSPIFYSVDSVPEPFRSVIELNPLTYVIEHVRNTLILGELPNTSSYLVYVTISVTVAWTGYAWFQKTRPGFADVM